MARTIKSNALTPGQILIVEGKVYFSRVTRRLDGEDLQRDMQSRKNAGLQPITDPYASLTLYETVAQATGNQVADTYLYESIYQGKKGYLTSLQRLANQRKMLTVHIRTHSLDVTKSSRTEHLKNLCQGQSSLRT